MMFSSLDHKTGIDLTVSSTLKKPSKNYTCFISKHFGLFFRDVSDYSRRFGRWIKNNPKRLEIKHA